MGPIVLDMQTPTVKQDVKLLMSGWVILIGRKELAAAVKPLMGDKTDVETFLAVLNKLELKGYTVDDAVKAFWASQGY